MLSSADSKRLLINPQAAAIAEQEECEARAFNAGIEQLKRQATHGRGDHPHDDEASSHSSHSSHSSYAARHGMAGVRPPAPILPPLFQVISTLAFLFAIQALGLYFFTKGFLLTRIELDGVSTCPPTPSFETGADESIECTLPPRYGRSLIFVVDALRYDFIAPGPGTAEEGSASWPYDPQVHAVVTTVDTLLHNEPRNALVAHFVADPPTTTLQRLKALMTGVLPTFIDAGANFGATEIAEDNLLAQHRRKLLTSTVTASSPNATVTHVGMGFMGDDTWMSVFPSAFDSGWTWPYDSFNVEDLDTVDAGVKAHLQHFLQAPNATMKDWRLLVAHNLGLDHAGHRYGPSHPELTRKLTELNDQLAFILEHLPDDALFILMGDHGMDAHGDHGGDGELETGAALLIYSKKAWQAADEGDATTRFLQRRRANLVTRHSEYAQELDSEPLYRPFRPLAPPSNATTSSVRPSPPLHRSIPQIDFVPSFALLHGLPIPFNSLGTVIPELFPGDLFLRALRANAHQIKRYLVQYESKSPDFKRFREELHEAWSKAVATDKQRSAGADDGLTREAHEDAAIDAYYAFNRLALARAKQVWARFDFAFMGAGLLLLATSIVAALRLQSALAVVVWEDASGYVAHPAVTTAQSPATALERVGMRVRRAAIVGLRAGTPIGIALAAGLWAAQRQGAVQVDLNIYGAPLVLASIALTATAASILSSSATAIKSSCVPSFSTAITILLIMLHAASIGSNSFLVWEDRATGWLLQTVLLLRGVRAMRAPTTVARAKMGVLVAIAMIATRAMISIRVCREEQAPNCETTFYAQRLTSTSAGDSPSPAGLGGNAAEGSTTVNSLLSSVLAYASAYLLPHAAQLLLTVVQSNTKLMKLFFSWIIRPSLMMGSGYWMLDTLLTQEWVHSNDKRVIGLATWGKLALARSTLCFLLSCIIIIWPSSPLPLELKVEDANGAQTQGPSPAPPVQQHVNSGPKQRATIVGLRNVMGSSYLILFFFIFGLQYLVAQPMGQVAASLSLLALLCLVDIGASEAILSHTPQSLTPSDAVAGAAARQDAPPSPAGPLQILSLALLGHLTFFSTGHQAVLPSIQWRTAFVGYRQVTQPFSGMLVALNSFGPLTILPGLSIPLVVMWQQAPRPRGASAAPMPTMNYLLRAGLLLLVWQSCMTLASCVFAAGFRRHLMLFKIWAPRFMLAGVSLVGVHIMLILGILAAGIIMSKTAQTLGTDFACVQEPQAKSTPAEAN
ncbi:hypothetical protein K437DRAFT_274428 [Tilletiaria anomala UBC 951]|uniref:Uncharacterized protein n=1 Tax=Tilletiaria anomala (strain ATCC 24038 / CBS 436.72 / UBC 951) TaxID=1037660 RepID=A0A066VXB1_TILAU|nr:uncharacterized protein K437DRAFT_274428 [Tilletiaria anomala UBC 951]KDN44908.1 hypothetical protein K437DRAFT_274428 [Tilletiaria anomala UBC 951]